MSEYRKSESLLLDTVAWAVFRVQRRDFSLLLKEKNPPFQCSSSIRGVQGLPGVILQVDLIPLFHALPTLSESALSTQLVNFRTFPKRVWTIRWKGGKSEDNGTSKIEIFQLTKLKNWICGCYSFWLPDRFLPVRLLVPLLNEAFAPLTWGTDSNTLHWCFKSLNIFLLSNAALVGNTSSNKRNWLMSGRCMNTNRGLLKYFRVDFFFFSPLNHHELS